MTVLKFSALLTPPSRTSPLPHWIAVERQCCVHPRSLWERACPRRRWVSQRQWWLTNGVAKTVAPTLARCRTPVLCSPKITVGASLLAKAERQSTAIEDDEGCG